MVKEHIDEVQVPTVDEHYKLIIEDNNFIDDDVKDVTPNDLPHWYDERLYKKAQNFYYRNVTAITVNNTIGLIAVLAIADIQKVLIHAGQHSTKCLAYKRYLETSLHIKNLYMADPNDPDSDWYRSMNMIRLKHKTSNKRSCKAGIGGIYQRDMALTQFAFVGYVYIQSESIGLRLKPEEEEAFNHFWRVNGYMLTISDRLNICRKIPAETAELCRKIATGIYAEYLNNVSPKYYNVVSTVINSLWYIDVTLDTNAFLALTYRFHGVESKIQLGWYNWLNMKYRDILLRSFLIPYIGPVIKVWMNYSLLSTFWIAENFPVLAWTKFGIENSRIQLFSKLKQF